MIVDKNRRTRPATCRSTIPRRRSSIFAGDLGSNEKRRRSLSVCVCFMDVGLVGHGHGCVAAARSTRTASREGSWDGVMCVNNNKTTHTRKPLLILFTWGNLIYIEVKV